MKKENDEESRTTNSTSKAEEKILMLAMEYHNHK